MPSSPPLSGVRIVEACRELAGSVAGWLLSELGADVIRLEEDDAALVQPASRLFHRSKRALRADSDSVERLLRHADALVVGRDDAAADPRLSRTAATGANADLLHVLVSPAGTRGPLADLAWDDGLIQAISGIGAQQWAHDGGPVHLTTPITEYACGMQTALAVAAGLHARLAGAGGQGVETSLLGAALQFESGSYVAGAKRQGSVLGHAQDPRGVVPTYSFYEASDGWLFVGALTQVFWVKLCTAIERLDLLAHPELQGVPLSFTFPPERRTFVRETLEAVFRQRERDDWLQLLTEHDVPCGPVLDRRTFFAHPQTEAAEMVVNLDDPVIGRSRQPGVPLRFSRTPSRVAGTAPTAAAERAEWHEAPIPWPPADPKHTAAPLAGVKVLDLATYIAGALCPSILSDLGAEVIKIEPLTGDPFREGTAFGFPGWNRGVRSVSVDLQDDEVRAAFFRMVASADLIVDNYRPGVLQRLGIDRPSLAQHNPGILQLSLTGYGPDGPLAARAGFDPIMQGMSGLALAQGGDEPVLYTMPYTDYATATMGALAAVSGLVARGLEHLRSGAHEGQSITTALIQSAVVMQAAFFVEPGGGELAPPGERDRRGEGPHRRFYRTTDGWLFVAAPDATTLARALGSTREGLEEAFASGTSATQIGALARAGLAAARARHFPDLLDDPHLEANGLWWTAHHEELGEITQPGRLIRFSKSRTPLGPVAPPLGRHTREALAEYGVSDATLDDWEARGAIRQWSGPPEP